MKIFVTSDIHGRLSVVHKITEFLRDREDIDYIILCGDITGDYSWECFSDLEEKQYENYRTIRESFKDIKGKLLFIQGNHDVFSIDKDDNNYLPNNNSEELKEFISMEYLNLFMYGTKREGNEQDMKYRLSKIDIENESIIISHIPPFKCLDRDNNGVHYGSKSIREMIKNKKPAYFFCGHVHDGFGFKKLYNTKVFNVACNDSNTRGWIVDLKTEKYSKVIL